MSNFAKGLSGKIIVVSIVSIVIVSAIVVGLIYNPNQPTDFTIEEFELTINDIDPSTIGVNEWLEDFYALYSCIRYNYPYLSLKERTHGYNWLDLRESFENRIRAADDNAEFFSIISEAVQALQNRHTKVVFPGYYPMYQQSYGSWIYICQEVFNNDVVDASSYWEAIYNDYHDNKVNSSYDAKIVYDRGVYKIVDGFGTWVEKYGNQTVIIEVDGEPIDDAIETRYEKNYLDWDFAREKLYLWMITPNEFGNAVFKIRDESGHESEVTFDIINSGYENPYCYPTSLSSPLIFRTWEDQSIAYIYFRSFSYYLEPYYQDILDFLGEVENYDHLIVDIRGNEGGSSSNWVNYLVGPLVNETQVLPRYLAYKNGTYINDYRRVFDHYQSVEKDIFESLPPEVLRDDFKIYNFSRPFDPINQVNFNGSVSLLTDQVSYSAAENLAIYAKESGFASLYGIPSGGDGIIPTPIFLTLPNSKIVIKTACAIGLEQNGEANEEWRTIPDFYYESAFGDFDELIEYVKERLQES
ncbi:MAG: S41 family peptidase [Candidatus Thorarchaeota archaeon]|jgi:hypothetical protein